MSPRSALIALAAVACGAAILLLPRSDPPAGAAADLKRLQPALERIAVALEDIGRRLPPLPVAGRPGPPSGDDDASTSGERADATAAVEALRLEIQGSLKRLEASREGAGASAFERERALWRATDLAAIASIRELHERNPVAGLQSLLLLSPRQVLERLGMPTNAGVGDDGNPRWYYEASGAGYLVIVFADGYAADVKIH